MSFIFFVNFSHLLLNYIHHHYELELLLLFGWKKMRVTLYYECFFLSSFAATAAVVSGAVDFHRFIRKTQPNCCQNKTKKVKKMWCKKGFIRCLSVVLNTRKSRLLCGLTSNNIVVAWRIKRRRKKTHQQQRPHTHIIPCGFFLAVILFGICFRGLHTFNTRWFGSRPEMHLHICQKQHTPNGEEKKSLNIMNTNNYIIYEK